MRTRIDIEAKIAYYKGEMKTAEDGLEVMLLSRSINELEWVLGTQELFGDLEAFHG